MNEPQIVFAEVDPEARFGLPCGRNTNPSNVVCFFLAILFTIGFYALCLFLWKLGLDERVWSWSVGTDFYYIPVAIAFLTAWSCAILMMKSLKVRAQRKALSLRLLPEQPGFVLTRGTVDDVLTHVEQEIIGADKFTLVYRVMMGLRSAKNTGRIAETDTVIESIAESDESIMESGYTIVRGFIWAIPVIGFIGTIIGLTIAIGNFAFILPEPGSATGLDPEKLTSGLGDVIGGLNTAFVTTGEALICALLVQLLLTFVRNGDESFLDDCRRYTSRHVLPRLRIEKDED